MVFPSRTSSSSAAFLITASSAGLHTARGCYRTALKTISSSPPAPDELDFDLEPTQPGVKQP